MVVVTKEITNCKFGQFLTIKISAARMVFDRIIISLQSINTFDLWKQNTSLLLEAWPRR